MLEEIVETKTSPTLKEELGESIRSYPSTWMKYFKQLAPAVVVSSIGSALGQWAAKEFGFDSNAAMTAAAYVCGYVPGYTTFFALEYLQNKEKYPSVFSKEFGEFAGTFLAADYVADLTTFTPAFISSNVWMANHTDLHPAARSMIAWNSAAMLYITTMAALHPVARRVNEAINTKVKAAYRAISGKAVNSA